MFRGNAGQHMSTMTRPRRSALRIGLLAAVLSLPIAEVASAQDYRRDDAYRPPLRQDEGYRQPLPSDDGYRRPLDNSIRPLPRDDAYRPPARDYGASNYGSTYGNTYNQPNPPPPPTRYGDPYDAGRQPPPTRYGSPYEGPRQPPPARYGDPYAPPPPAYDDRGRPYDERMRPHEEPGEKGTFSNREILEAGHGFFGTVSKGLAGVIEYAFKSQGRPNGYILGQDAGGALVAGLRYGEGILHTKDAGTHRVYWQGPSIGWDAGAEGSKVMVLVYNLQSPDQIYQRFPGVSGVAYLVGGVGINFQEADGVVVAPIRAGIGLRLGANVGYLKYTREPTWNPF